MAKQWKKQSADTTATHEQVVTISESDLCYQVLWAHCRLLQNSKESSKQKRSSIEVISTCHDWYCNLSNIPPWVINLRSSSKGGGGRHIFESCDISREYTPTSYAASLALLYSLIPRLLYMGLETRLALLMYMCSDSAMLLLSSTCLHNCMYCCINRWAHPLQQVHSKRGWAYFWGWAYF